LAAQGYSGAELRLGDMYESSRGVPQNYGEALKHYQSAAKYGDPRGLTAIGHFHRQGLLFKRDPAAAIKIYIEAFEHGDVKAAWYISDMYFKGEGVSKDDAKGLEWVTKAAQFGDILSQFQLGDSYFGGTKGLPRNLSRALMWYHLAGTNSAKTGPADADVQAFNTVAEKLILAEMLPEQIAEAKRLEEEWLKSGMPKPRIFDDTTKEHSFSYCTASDHAKPQHQLHPGMEIMPN
jgi:Sel1 repeat